MTGLYDTADDLWRGAISDVQVFGRQSPSRVGGMREVLGWSAKLANIKANFVFNARRRLTPYYAAGEFLWFMTGKNDVDFIKAFAPTYDRWAEPSGQVHGCYGSRWFALRQYDVLLKLLREKPDTRRAVLQCWDNFEWRDLEHSVTDTRKDVPCMLSLQFLIREKRLHCVATIRSNDVWLGMPYDIFTFTTLQALLAAELEIEPGEYTHNVGSLHIYDRYAKGCEEAMSVSAIASRHCHPNDQAWSKFWRGRDSTRDQGLLNLHQEIMLLVHTPTVSLTTQRLDAIGEKCLLRSLFELYVGWLTKSRNRDWAMETNLYQQAKLVTIGTDSKAGEE